MIASVHSIASISRLKAEKKLGAKLPIEIHFVYRTLLLRVYFNKRSDSSMEVKLPAL